MTSPTQVAANQHGDDSIGLEDYQDVLHDQRQRALDNLVDRLREFQEAEREGRLVTLYEVRKGSTKAVLTWPHWTALRGAYWALRRLYIRRRKPTKRAPEGHVDPTLQRWDKDRASFREAFYLKQTTPEWIQEVMAAYWTIRNKFHLKEEPFRTRRNERSRERGYNKTEAAKASKAKWAAKAWASDEERREYFRVKNRESRARKAAQKGGSRGVVR